MVTFPATRKGYLPQTATAQPGSTSNCAAGSCTQSSSPSAVPHSICPPASLPAPAGVGYGAVLAHEVALQLSDSSAEGPPALALFEGAHSLRSPARLLSWLPAGKRQEVCQVAATLYPAVLAGAGAGAPSLEAFAARLASIAGYDEQLDYVATFKPAEVRGRRDEGGMGWVGVITSCTWQKAE